MKKQVRYAVGVAGAVPAFGLMVPANATTAATTAHIAKTAKQVRVLSAGHQVVPASTTSGADSTSLLATCSGHQGNHRTNSGVTVRFYSAPYGTSRTCIGTIQVSTTHTTGSNMRGWVHNAYGAEFCDHSGNVFFPLNWPCKHPFRRKLLGVTGAVSFARGSTIIVNSPYPFRHNGFN